MSGSPYDERERNLALATANAVSVDGWRVESQSAGQVILYKQRKTRHGLYLAGSLVTLLPGFFIGFFFLLFCLIVIGWIVDAALSKRHTLILRVDDYGNVLRTQS